MTILVNSIGKRLTDTQTAPQRAVLAAVLLVACGACATQATPIVPPPANTAGVTATGVAGSSAAGSGVIAPVAGAGATAGTAAVSGASAAGAGVAGSASAATFTAVLAIFADPKNNCGLCHAMMNIGGGLVFKPTDKQATFAALVGTTSKGMLGSQCGGKTYVVAGQPDASLLYDKLAKATPSCGVRMPASGVVLTDMEIATVRAWITAGAMNN